MDVHADRQVRKEDYTAGLEKSLRRSEVGAVVKNHQLLGPEEYDRERTTVAIGEFDFVRAVRVRHHNGADLTAVQKQRPTAFEVLRAHILQQGDHVVHVDSG
jgi:hypothetical protein